MEIFGIGIPEILMIAVVALIILGPDRLPAAARTLGKGIADFRRAIEPAREVWTDVTRELSDTIEGNLPTKTVTGAAITGNPWKVHPLAEGLSEEERDTYFKTGALPEWKLAEMEAKGGYLNGNSPPIPEETDLDYPAPHSDIPGDGYIAEELDYPEPTHSKPKETTIE